MDPRVARSGAGSPARIYVALHKIHATIGHSRMKSPVSKNSKRPGAHNHQLPGGTPDDRLKPLYPGILARFPAQILGRLDGHDAAGRRHDRCKTKRLCFETARLLQAVLKYPQPEYPSP